MSTENTEDGVAFSCDECGKEKLPPRLSRGSAKLDFQECLALAKDDGWTAVPVKSRTGKIDWQHRCPECRGK